MAFPVRRAVAGSVVWGVLAVGCSTVLRPLDRESTATRLPQITDGMPRESLFVSEACTSSLKYADRAGRILVYGLDFPDQQPVCDATGKYELVLIIDGEDRLSRHRLLRVR